MIGGALGLARGIAAIYEINQQGDARRSGSRANNIKELDPIAENQIQNYRCKCRKGRAQKGSGDRQQSSSFAHPRLYPGGRGEGSGGLG